MKVLFAGPSLAADMPALVVRHPRIRFEGPVARGDVHRAVAGGATAIGIVDGVFREAPPVWHKEILHALSLGVAVAGGASMGALRAAECSAFGMVGIGAVHALLASGAELDDACVAQVHAPAELGWTALSEAAVTVDATIAGLRAAGALTPDEAAALRRANRVVAFPERTMAKVATAAVADPSRRREIARLLAANRDDIKRRDGLEVLAWLDRRPDARASPPTGWRFAETAQWRAFLNEEAAAGTRPNVATR